MNRAASVDDLRWLWLLAPGAAAVGAALAISGLAAHTVIAVAVLFAYVLFGVVSTREPLIFVTVFLLALEVFPPLYFSEFGETPVFVSFFLLPIALAIIVTRSPDFHFEWDSVARGLAMFLAGTALSIPFGFWLSGVDVGMSGLSRWLLLSQAAPVFCLIRGGGRRAARRAERQMFRLLLAGAVLSAGYGIIDFVWPVPLPHPAADQFIWLDGVVLRRAQGVFYESSNFANFCGLFLVAGATALLSRTERYLGYSRLLLMVFISVLSLAVLVAFSRSTWASIIAALLVSSVLSRQVKLTRVAAVLAAVAIPFFLLWVLSPELWNYLVSARVGRLVDIFNDPNSATSGRFDTWLRVIAIMGENPQYLIFGVGYKTLTVTRLFHGEIITDNGYLSLLLETGFAGLGGFLVFSGAILRTFLRLSRSANEVLSFWATVLFSIWCGELVQLLAADAYTYWRNIVILAALMAWTLNIAERQELSGRPA
jgi:hypothetical protein